MDSLLFSARWHKRKTVLLLCVTLALAAAAELLPMLPASAALLPEEPALELPPPGYVEPEEPEPPAPNYLGKTGVYLETEEDVVPYDTVYEDDYTLPKGETAVKQAGQPYHRILSYEITYYHDREQQRRFAGEEVLSDTVTEVIAVGTLVKEARAGDKIKKVVKLDDGSGYLLMTSGDSLRFTAA